MKPYQSLAAVVAFIAACLVVGACDDNGGSGQKGNNLDQMRTARVTLESATIQSWIAETFTTRQKGLMFVQSDQMQPLDDGAHKGMLFVFPFETVLSFWMKDTYIPLDIAYARSDGTIVKTYTMTPLDTENGKYSSQQPARFALEVKAGLFAELGVSEGDVIHIPPEVLNPPP